MSGEIRDATGDAERWHARNFLQQAIGDDPISPFLSLRGEQLQGCPSDVLHIVDHEGIEAATHFGRPYVEADEFTTKGGQPSTSARLLEQTRMLHSIAVRPNRRRTGLGRALLDEIEHRATSSGAFIIFGVASGPVDADEFYLEHGYDVGPASTPLVIKLGNQVMVFPLVLTEARWFVKIIAQPPQRRRRLFRKPEPVYADAVFMDLNKPEQLRS